VTAALLEVTDLVKVFPVRRGGMLKRQVRSVRAVDGVSFVVDEGETMALVGESGCGKSTVARSVLRLHEPTSGRVVFAGEDVTGATAPQLQKLRRQMQLVFQDPYASLNPRMTVRAILSEPFQIHGLPVDGQVEQLLAQVGLSPEHASRYPHEFSGGQRQRVGVARAIALGPKLVICDEPVSALDVSVRTQVLNVLEDLQRELGLSYLLISHDLAVVRHLARRIAVMYLGRVVEMAPTEELLHRSRHPYTQSLISAVPLPDPRRERARTRIILRGDPPDPANPPSGCSFRTRCPLFASELSEADRARCVQDPPDLIDDGNGHALACHFGRVRAVR
jgi:peptide/nickel transport system ATP-binding protein/oligopeptide transport system ATP-binding protein